jgi:hypothetical protein
MRDRMRTLPGRACRLTQGCRKFRVLIEAAGGAAINLRGGTLISGSILECTCVMSEIKDWASRGNQTNRVGGKSRRPMMSSFG